MIRRVREDAMAYFSSGSEGMDYQARYCARCQHDTGSECCAVWEAHLMNNGHDDEGVLNILIPRTADGLDNKACRMFIEVS